MEFLTIKDLARFLRLNPKSLSHNYRKLGIPHYRLGRQIRFDLEEVESWLERQRIQ